MRNKDMFSAVILAAGYSSRMGKLKPLLKFGEKIALEILINTYIESKVEDVIVVVGHRGDEIIEKLKGLSVKWVVNKDFASGMYSSVARGVKEIDRDSKGFFVNPVDIPGVKSSTVTRLKDEFLKGEKGIIYPAFNREKGHPPLISAYYKDAILESTGEGGLKRILGEFEKDSGQIAVCDNASIMDMDTPRDYLDLLEYFKTGNCPNLQECMAIWDICDTSAEGRRHCVAVAETAVKIGEKILKKGYNINIEKIRSAALLHDMARSHKDHAKKAEWILRDLGYSEIAKIVSVHMDIHMENSNDVTEEEILYLADKLTDGDKLMTLSQRFKGKIEKYKDDPRVLVKVMDRYENASVIQAKIAGIVGEVT